MNFSFSSRIILIAFISIGYWGCGSQQPSNNSDEDTSASSSLDASNVSYETYQTLAVSPDSMSRELNITGRIQPLEKIQIVSEVQGKVLPLSKKFNEGMSYKRGEAMIKIDSKQYLLTLKSQKSQFQSNLVRIMSKVKLDYPDAHGAWDKYLRSFDADQPLASLPEVTDEQLRYLLAANNIYSSFYNIKSAEEVLAKYYIYAPFSGVITEGRLSQGAVVSPGVPLGSFSRTDTYELKAAVSSALIDYLKLGQKIELTHSNTGKRYQGIVNRFGGSIDPSTQSIPVFIQVRGKGLKEGMFLEAYLDAASFEDVVAIPLTALNRNNQVHVIKDSTVVLHDVTPVNYDQDQVWVTGLAKGTEVITEEIIQPIVGIKAISQN